MRRKKFLVELSIDGIVVLKHFDKMNFFQKKKGRTIDNYSRYKDNYYWFIYNKIKWSYRRVEDDSSVYDMLWTNKEGEVTSYAYLNIEPISNKEIQKISKDKRLQGVYDFEIFYHSTNGLKRIRGTITRVLKYARVYGLSHQK